MQKVRSDYRIKDWSCRGRLMCQNEDGELSYWFRDFGLQLSCKTIFLIKLPYPSSSEFTKNLKSMNMNGNSPYISELENIVDCIHVTPTNQCRFSLVQYIRCLLIYIRINPFHTLTIDLQINAVQTRISKIIGQNTISGVFYNPKIRFITRFV